MGLNDLLPTPGRCSELTSSHYNLVSFPSSGSHGKREGRKAIDFYWWLSSFQVEWRKCCPLISSSQCLCPQCLVSPGVLSIVFSLSLFTASLGKLIHTCGFHHHLCGNDAQISIFSLVLTMEVQMDTCTEQTPGAVCSNWYSTHVNLCSFPRLLSVQIL